MRITTKINLLTTSWLIFILLITNVFVFFSFMKITVNMEEEVVFRKAHEIIEENKNPYSVALTDNLLESYLTNHSFIRIVNPHSKIVKEVTNDRYLSNIKAKFSTKNESQLRKMREEQVLIVRVPISSHNRIIGTLEIGERLMGLEMRKDILLSILTVCSMIAVFLSLLGGKWLSNVIIRPISNMITTMKEIEQSGILKPILIQNETPDELQKMAITFNRMIERLQENLEKQKQFVSDASHELKTPLTVIKSYVDLLRRRGIQNEKIAMEAIETIYLESMRMQKMTEALLDLATSEKETMLEIKSVNLISICQHILHQLQNVYKRQILLHYSLNPIMVEVDELKMKQVIIILLDNAIKYSKDKIEVFVEKYEKHVAIWIKDYGIGIPKEDIKHIFERFYRVDKSRNRETGGTGLGLSIAKNIIKQHQGEINIRSEEGKGTEVELLIPTSYINH
ncbi:sensor histidine kinase [Bacillus methanolicus]|uniref:HAMP domain-containing sensor histidine kinase n=1 Tax=Bacillus methanolicus TaxID=1471 RepID=UPI00200CE15B|nr:HAMP domain-containing histidine kinase [Bacillus methanolicus]UQD53136.1 sensor histidine kinase [Bacillus methanolicus]